jgi:hypothetical protein
MAKISSIGHQQPSHPPNDQDQPPCNQIYHPMIKLGSSMLKLDHLVINGETICLDLEGERERETLRQWKMKRKEKLLIKLQ